MDYEREYDKPLINMHFLAILGLCALIVIIMFYPIYKTSMNARANEEQKFIDTNVSTAIEIQYITVLVTPTPDGKLYYASEYQSGIRKYRHSFNWIKHNVSGYQTMKGSIQVYDYKTFNKVHWFNPTDYKYYEMPARDGMQYLFVFFNIYLDDIAGEDTRLFLPQRESFVAHYKGTTINHLEYPYQIRFKELEETFNFNDDMRVKAFRQKPAYSSDLKYKSTAGEYSQEIDYLYGGKSNAEDGYLIYEIPNNANIEDINICSSIYAFGKPCWRLIE